jgi:putative transposase
VSKQAMRIEVTGDIRCMLNALDQNFAEEYLQAAIQKYVVTAPELFAWLKENLSEGFTVFNSPL